MIDWGGLVANALWIIGCALGLAVLSYANWEAGMRGERLRFRLRQPRMQCAINLAGALFCLGLAVTSDSAIATILWLFLTVSFFARLWSAVVSLNRVGAHPGSVSHRRGQQKRRVEDIEKM